MTVTYLDHFGLRWAPFDMTPKPALLHDSPGHQRVLEWMEKGIAARLPLLVLTGDAGVGKTTLLRLLRSRHRRNWIIGLIWRFQSSVVDIRVQARRVLGLPDRRDDSPDLSAGRIRRYAGSMRAKGRITLLAVDEAQELTTDSMAALTSLTAGDAGGSGLTVLLIGRPDLRAVLAAADLRIEDGACAGLAPFTESETADYVAHRLAESGARAPIFDQGATAVLHAFSKGVPRLINTMADYCLRIAAAKGLSQIDAAWIRPVLQDATSVGALSHLGQRTEAPQSGRPAAPAMRQIPAGDADPAVPPPVPEAVSAQGTPLWRQTEPAAPVAVSDVPRKVSEPNAWRSALAARVQARQAQIASEPPLPPDEAGKRRGLSWAVASVAAALVVAGGAAFLWLQQGSAPVPAATMPVRSLTDVAMEQAPPPVDSQAALPPAKGAWRMGIPVLSPVPVTPEPTAAALMKQALETESHDPAAAAVAYARAALRGHARAAYYLGQLYETGAGVEPSRGSARLWYAAASALPAARRRLQALPAPSASAGSPATPVPIFQARLDNGSSEMIWRAPEGVTPARFRLEALGPAGNALPPRQTTLPGLVLRFPVSAWRVTAIGADGRESAPSAMVRMTPAQN